MITLNLIDAVSLAVIIFIFGLTIGTFLYGGNLWDS